MTNATTSQPVTPTEELREAARLMRERAEKATPGPWVADIASMHPAVALAVAEWLYREAFYAGRRVPASVEPEALSVARAYLGGAR